jgi:RHS repeat-associated protein
MDTKIFRVLGFLGAILIAQLGLGVANAQVDQAFETGLNPYRSYQSGKIDNINVWNRGLNVDIPIISYPQRGGKLTLNFVLHYANLGNWYDENCSSSPCSYTNSGAFPFSGFGVIQAGTFTTAGGTCGSGSPGPPQTEVCNYSVANTDGSSSILMPVNSTTWKSVDLMGYQLSNFTEGGTNPNVLLTDRNGIHYETNGEEAGPTNLLPLYSLSESTGDSPALAEDSNGNQITYNGYGPGQTPGTGWTDTRGRVIPLPTATSTSGCPQTPLVPDNAFIWNFPGLNGENNYTVTFCYAEVSYKILYSNGYSSGSLDQLQSVLLPNGTSWTFQYTSGANMDLSEITFPTGGTLSYTWAPVQNQSDPCAAHTYSNYRQVASRTLNANSSDGPAETWNYTGTGLGSRIFTDPAGNDTVHTFAPVQLNACPLYETTTQQYKGSYSTGTLLKTDETAYAPLGTGLPTGQPSTTNTLWASNSSKNQSSMTYDSALSYYQPIFVISTSQLSNSAAQASSFGLQLTKMDYDYTTGTLGTLLRTTTTTYEALSNSNYLTNNRLDLPASVVVTGSGPGSTTTYTYDQASTLQSSGITTQHDSAPPVGIYRGNLTEVSRYLNTTGAYLNTTSTTFDTGMPDVVTDPNGNTTTYGYSSTYAGALLTSVENAKNQTTAFAYDLNTGLQTSSADPNNLTTTKTYDVMERLKVLSNPDGGQVSYTYNDTTPSPSVDISITANSSGSPVTGVEILDGLGRLKQKQLTSDPSGTDYTDYTYDSFGRQYTVSNPYRGTPPNPSLLTTYAYDALGRSMTITEADNSVQQSQYCANATLSIDEAGIWKRTITDGLGRLIEADEPTSSSSTQNACAGQGGPIYATTYTYDVNGNVIGVVQAGSRQRTFVYDSLSRLTSSINPESNTEGVSPYTTIASTYTYDRNGNVLSKTSPAPNQQGTATQTISYCYDQLNRETQKAYTTQSCPMSSPVVTYAYDAAGSGTANIGRRTSMTESSGGTESWAYTINKTTSPKGLLVNDSRTTNSVNHTSAYQYNYDGSIGSILYPSGRTVTYTYNGAAQATAATDIANNTSYVSNGYYGPSGVLMQQSLGGAMSHTILYNTRLQPCWSWVGTGTALPTTDICTSTATAGTILDLKYNYNLGTDNGNLVSVTNDRDSTRSQTFSYDPVNRLSTAAASTYATSHGNCWGEQFGYDTTGNWGNLLSISAISSAYTGCTQESLSVTANAYNRITTLGYDSAGNTTTIPGSGGGSYTFNAENLITTTAGVTYTYDGDNARVETGGSSLYWYGPDGAELMDTDTTGSPTDSAAHDYVYFNGVRTARRDNVGDVYYYFDDQVGSVRAIAEVVSGQTTATLCLDTDYYPFGTQRSPIVSSCTTSQKFTGKHLDTESSLYNSGARYYPPFEGRFMSPDPAGMAAAGTSDPQSLNLYAYVRNRPLSLTDPTGLETCDAGDEPTCTPGALTYFGGSLFESPFADGHIPPLPKGMGDDCGTNPTLNGCPTGPAIPEMGCAKYGKWYCWDVNFHGGIILPPKPWRPTSPTPPRRAHIFESMQACLVGLDESSGGFLSDADDLGLYAPTAHLAVDFANHLAGMGLEAGTSATAENLRTAINQMDPAYAGGPPGAMEGELASTEAAEAGLKFGASLSTGVLLGATGISTIARMACYQASHGSF